MIGHLVLATLMAFLTTQDRASAQKFLAKDKEALDSFNEDEAIKLFTRSIELDVFNPDAVLHRGLSHYGLGDTAQAVSDYDTAIRLDPKFSKAYTARGRARMSQREQEKGFKDFATAIECDPKDPDPLHWRGLYYYQSSDRAKAVDDFERAIAVDPLSAIPYRDLGWVYAACLDEKRRDGKKALELAIKLHQRIGTHSSDVSLQLMAAAHAELGQFGNAAGVQAMALESIRLGRLPISTKMAEERLKQYASNRALRYDSAFDWLR